MMNLIFGLPDQFDQREKIGWTISGRANLPVCFPDANARLKPCPTENIVIAGMGGSAISGDVIRTLFWDEGALPVLVWRDYLLPRAVTAHTLFIAISYSGNTEETLCAYSQAKRKGSQIIVITSGGKLSELAKRDGFALLTIPKGMPPRAAIGFLTVAMLTALNRLGLCRSYEQDIRETARLLRRRMGFYRQRAQGISRVLAGRLPLVYSTSRLLDVGAYRWQCQLNENAKIMCHIGQLPEQNHNEIMGLGAPEFLARQAVIIALVDRRTHPRTRLRLRTTLKLIKDAYAKAVVIQSEGRSALARLFSVMVIGDFVSVVLAKTRGVDPMVIPKIDELKQMLAQIRRGV